MASKMPETMRAWTHEKAGKPQTVLSLSYDLPKPQIKSPTQVLVRVHYASLNPGGSIMMQLVPTYFRNKPCIPEMDFAGTIEQLGEGVPMARNLHQGVQVFGSIPVGEHMKGSGSLAEYVVVDADCVVPAPTQIKLEEAAGLGVAGCTALALYDAAKLQRGMKVLVNAAGGGIGSMILQLVVDAVGDEGEVVAVCSTEKEELARSLGAKEVIDYRAEANVYETLRNRYGQAPFDVVIDALGLHQLYSATPGFLRTKGSYVNVGVVFTEMTYRGMVVVLFRMLYNSFWPSFLGGTPRKNVQVGAFVNQGEIARLAKLCEEGKLKVPIDSCWGFEEVLKAYEQLLTKGAKGKVTVKI